MKWVLSENYLHLHRLFLNSWLNIRAFIPGEPVKMAMVNVNKKLPPGPMLRQLSENLTDLLPRLSVRYFAQSLFILL